ncbi:MULTISPECIES: glycine zipper 2TM domain-containing protein [unclassified Haloparvum]|uniref:glycine zipper 2TM domain-containing protein n=1 Tax=Haloparvum sp. PAK95 TaxID=3418962 RepID=UPI003D2EAA7F
MGEKLDTVLSRARYAAIGAAVGGGLGGLFGRSTASSGAALGGLVGAAVGEKRVSARSMIEQVRNRESSEE